MGAPVTIASTIASQGEILVHCGACRELRPIKLYGVPARLRGRDLRTLGWVCRKCGATASEVIVKGQQGVGGLRVEVLRFRPGA